MTAKPGEGAAAVVTGVAAEQVRLAPAKVNLSLHVTGQRDDGYHLLDSLVVRVAVADRLRVVPAEKTTFEVRGPMAAGVPVDGDNLVLRAARLLDPEGARGARITLEKHLPAAAGIGGGSADAAAAILALSALWDVPVPPNLSVLGSDVPVCLEHGPQRMRGIGDDVSRVTPLPDCALVLVNPRVPVPTGPVFGALPSKRNPAMDEEWPAFADAEALAEWLAAQRNDLETPARALVPEIGAVLAALAPRVLLARMSGSGATCFGLCATLAEAEAVAEAVRAAQPDWWVAAGPVLA